MPREETQRSMQTTEPTISVQSGHDTSLQRQALGKLSDIYFMLQQTNARMDGLTNRSRDNQGELGNLKAATHARDQEIREVLRDIREDLRTDTSKERMVRALEELASKVSRNDAPMQDEVQRAMLSIKHEIITNSQSSEEAVDAIGKRLDNYFSHPPAPVLPDLSILEIVHGRLQDTFDVLTLLSDSQKQQEISREKALHELEGIQKDRILATAQLTAVETALSFRKHEFHELTERAAELENRLRTAALERSQRLLLSHANPSSLFSSTKPETIARPVFKVPQVGARRHQSLSQMSSPNTRNNSPLQPKRPSRQFSLSKNLKGLFSKEKENIDEMDECLSNEPTAGPAKKSYGLLGREVSPPSSRWRSISERV